MGICKKCEDRERGMFAGQGFRDYTCALCGKTDVWANTNTPKFCDECSEKLGICQRCGADLNEKENSEIKEEK